MRCGSSTARPSPEAHLRNETDGSTDRAEWFPLESVRALHRVKLVDVGLRFAGIDHPAAAS